MKSCPGCGGFASPLLDLICARCWQRVPHDLTAAWKDVNDIGDPELIAAAAIRILDYLQGDTP